MRFARWGSGADSRGGAKEDEGSRGGAEVFQARRAKSFFRLPGLDPGSRLSLVECPVTVNSIEKKRDPGQAREDNRGEASRN